ncbi:Yos1-like protein [Scenedesmus sp. NREL 46B-D3]|nr:Yos1-like protein [Scenedesmus sp. NREL 46B-D3]
MLSLWNILQAVLMMFNGVAVLNNERFLEKYGWGFSQMQSSNSLKMSVIGGIHAVHYFRAFLMVINSVVIVIKLLSG